MLNPYHAQLEWKSHPEEAKIMQPKVIGRVLGENVDGGGEGGNGAREASRRHG